MRPRSTRLARATHPGPLGPVHLLVSSEGLCRTTLPGGDLDRELRAIARRLGAVEVVDGTADLDPYLEAMDGFYRGAFTPASLPLDLSGTPFQRQVWLAMRDIPWGQVVTYGELAARVGRPGASRAVGSACGANPIPLLLPCHRVVASGGRLGGFGGGPGLKRSLLAREGIQLG